MRAVEFCTLFFPRPSAKDINYTVYCIKKCKDQLVEKVPFSAQERKIKLSTRVVAFSTRAQGIGMPPEYTDKKVLETDFDDPNFDYVVEIRAGEKICFGSTIERNTSPIGKGLSPFQKQFAHENFKPGPGYYDIDKITSAMYATRHKIRSKRGVGPLASRDKRFKDKMFMRVPSPGRYDVEQKKDFKPSLAPFNVSAKIEHPTNNNPGPATYDIRKTRQCRRTRMQNNFGKPEMMHAIETICIAKPVDTCHKCNALCKGDYWHKDYTLFLCHLCWEEEKHTREIYQPQQLKEFRKIRNCSFMHQHEETQAALKILTAHRLKKKIRLANYLDLYIQC